MYIIIQKYAIGGGKIYIQTEIYTQTEKSYIQAEKTYIQTWEIYTQTGEIYTQTGENISSRREYISSRGKYIFRRTYVRNQELLHLVLLYGDLVD